MRRNCSFRTSLLVSFWIVLLLALLLPPWYYYRILTKEITEGSQSNAIQQLNLVQWMLDHEEGVRTVEELQEWLVDVGLQLGVRMTYVAEGGRVVADSEIPFSEVSGLDNHGSRPEIAQAQSQDVAVVVRFSGTTQKEFIYAAKRVSEKGAISAGILRLAAPFSKVKEPLDRFKNSFLLFPLLLFIATASLSYALVRRLNSPIRAMIDTAEAISTKDFKKRIRSSPGQEFYPLTQSINKMAESIETHVRTITDQKQQLEAVFNAMQEGVMVLDSKGKIRSTNRTFSTRISSGTEVIGRRPLEVIVNIELQHLCDRVMALTGGDSESETRPHKLQIGLGEERTYDVNVVRMPAQQREMGAVAVFHDITELKRLEKVRRDFVANVSHELRTPLTSIKGYTETLLTESQSNPQVTSSFLQVILKNANHLVKMVEDLLQLTRLEAPHELLKPVPVNAVSALTMAWKSCELQAESKNLRLENTLPARGVLVSTDFDQLVQVFRNLLENAIRYSPPHAVITVSCESQGDKATFSIRDEGTGIPRQHQQRIFERFYRVEKHRSDQFGSTGLGLAICRHILRNHGGRIWVQSPNPEDEKGSTFFFTLTEVLRESNKEAGEAESAAPLQLQ